MTLTFRFTTFALLAASVPVFSQAAKPKTARPNVIYIYADDLGKGMLSAYGQRQFSTPNIDSLIHHGVSFANAYGCMLSAPARASLLTGYHDCHTDKWRISNGSQYIVNSPEEIAAVEHRLDSADITLPSGDYYLPQVFKQAGYTTAQIGKLEWGFAATREQMKAHGWDYYYGYLDHVRCHGYYPPWLFDNGRIDTIVGNTLPNCGKSIENETEETYRERWDRNGKSVYSQDIFVKKIIQFIDEHQNKPFFLYHPSQLPHGPVSVPAIDPELANNPNLTSLEKEYATMVKILDNTVGAITAELRRLGMEENTIVIFAADNGHEIYYSQKGRCEKPYKNFETGQLFDDYNDKFYSEKGGDRFNGNAGMAGLKRSNLEGGVHIPLAFYWKNHLSSGKVVEDIVSNYDFLPTMAEMLNVRLSTKKDGRSFLKLFSGKAHEETSRYIVFGSNYGPAIVTNDGWKLRYYQAEKTFELYNVRKDYREEHNLINQYPKKAEQLKAILLRECGGDLSNGINKAG